MSRKRTVFVLVCLVAVVLVFQFRGRITNRERKPPDNPPGAPTTTPGMATVHYWRETGLFFRSAGRAITRIEEQAAVLSSGKLKTARELKEFWDRWSALYLEDVGHSQRAIEGIEQLPTQGVDRLALDVASEAVEYLRVRVKLHQASSRDCASYSALFADIDAAGGVADEDSPEGTRFSEREREIIAVMNRRAAEEGKAENEKLKAFLTAAEGNRIKLSAKYDFEFPDINRPAAQVGGR
jgi:hypothetical protein